jgi:hypothetical protein
VNDAAIGQHREPGKIGGLPMEAMTHSTGQPSAWPRARTLAVLPVPAVPRAGRNAGLGGDGQHVKLRRHSVCCLLPAYHAHGGQSIAGQLSNSNQPPLDGGALGECSAPLGQARATVLADEQRVVARQRDGGAIAGDGDTELR